MFKALTSINNQYWFYINSEALLYIPKIQVDFTFTVNLKTTYKVKVYWSLFKWKLLLVRACSGCKQLRSPHLHVVFERKYIRHRFEVGCGYIPYSSGDNIQCSVDSSESFPWDISQRRCDWKKQCGTPVR